MLENKKFIEEQKVFDKILFVKKETQRLIEKEKNKPEYYFTEQADSEIGLMSRKMKEYEANLSRLQNNRVQSMLQNTAENKNLALLLEAGLLNSEMQIEQVIQKAARLKIEHK